jgi:hypothetical protein
VTLKTRERERENLKCIRRVRKCGLDPSTSGYGLVAGSFEQGNDNSDSTKGGKFLDKLDDCQLLEKNDILCNWVIFVYLINIAIISLVSIGITVLPKFK